MLEKKLVDLGCEVVAIDSSAAQVGAARTLGLDARVMDAETLPFAEEFDAVFSNAVLQWIKRADPMISALFLPGRADNGRVGLCPRQGISRPMYGDGSDHPLALEYGVLDDRQLAVEFVG